MKTVLIVQKLDFIQKYWVNFPNFKINLSLFLFLNFAYALVHASALGFTICCFCEWLFLFFLRNSLQCRRFLWTPNLLAKAPRWNFPRRGGDGASQREQGGGGASSETQGQIKGAKEILNGRKNMYGTMKSKERWEEPLGTMSYQTSSKWSLLYWLLIGAWKPIRSQKPPTD